MEYQIDIVDFKERGGRTAICTTKWLNLGAGLTTLDTNWRGHNLRPHEYVPHDLPLGSIRSGYENREGAAVDELTAANNKRLVSSLRPKGSNVYIDPQGCNWKLAGHNIWYMGPPEESSTIPSLFRRLLRTIAQSIGV